MWLRCPTYDANIKTNPNYEMRHWGTRIAGLQYPTYFDHSKLYNVQLLK